MKNDYFYTSHDECGACLDSDSLKKDNYFSEFKTEVEKSRARKNLGIGDLYTLRWENIGGFVEDNPQMKAIIDSLFYNPVKVSYYIEFTPTTLKFKWAYNKNNIIQLKFDSTPLEPEIREIVLLKPYNKVQYPLSTNDGQLVFTSNLSLKLIYYSDNPNLIQDMVLNDTFTIDTSGYIYIFVPKEIEVQFKVGGFEGGFHCINSDYKLTYFEGLELDYMIYQSDNSNLGKTKVDIIWQLN